MDVHLLHNGPSLSLQRHRLAVGFLIFFVAIYKEVNIQSDASVCDYSGGVSAVYVKRCKCNIVVSWRD